MLFKYLKSVVMGEVIFLCERMMCFLKVFHHIKGTCSIEE